MEGVMTDVSVKEEDREIDIESYSTETVASENKNAETASEEDDQLPVNVDKAYEE
jgi:small subunit ribosomal protein S2